MGIKNRQFLAQIQNDLKAFDTEVFLAPKFILEKGIDIAADFIKKDNDNRKIWKLSEGWTELECLPMQEVPITSCPELDTYTCKLLMRSKDRIPDQFSTRYGNLIKSVASIEYSQFYDPVSPRQYKALMQREFIDHRKKYYFFIGGYIYLPNTQVESIRIEAYFKRQWEVAILNQKNNPECSTCQEECIKPLDFDFVCPEYLINPVKQELYKQLREVYLQIHPDSYPNIKPEDKQEEKTAGKKNG